MEDDKILVMPFTFGKKDNKVGKAAIEFNSGPLAGSNMVGFTICEDKEKKLYVQFPSSLAKRVNGEQKPYYFIRPKTPTMLEDLENAILDVYDSMIAFNSPRAVSKPRRIDSFVN